MSVTRIPLSIDIPGDVSLSDEEMQQLASQMDDLVQRFLLRRRVNKPCECDKCLAQRGQSSAPVPRDRMS